MIKEIIKKMLGSERTKRLSFLKYRILNIFCNFFPMQKEIILESHPDFACNSYALYKYFIKKGINKNYIITWLIDGSLVPRFNDENVKFLNMYPRGFYEKIKYYIHCNRARILIASNRHRPKYKASEKQLNIYLDHGSQAKSMLKSDGSRMGLSCDYLICQSSFFIPYNLSQYTLTEEQIICTGLPRNDELFIRHNSLKRLVCDIEKFNKVIIWVPTFRQHKNEYRIDCKHDYPLGLPIFNSLQDFCTLNEVLIKERTLLLIKPHPAQRLDLIKVHNLSNVRLIYNNEMFNSDIQMNELLEQVDAMITDYSSIYYDYLLTHRPIGITLDDYDDYAGEKGFVFDDPLEVFKGFYIYTPADFFTFIQDTAKGIDREKKSREEICRIIHTFQDGNSSARVFKFIMSKVEERFKD